MIENDGRFVGVNPFETPIVVQEEEEGGDDEGEGE